MVLNQVTRDLVEDNNLKAVSDSPGPWSLSQTILLQQEMRQIDDWHAKEIEKNAQTKDEPTKQRDNKDAKPLRRQDVEKSPPLTQMQT